MADDVMSHISSNSNQSDPTLPLKLAKLEARMAGKPSSSGPGQVGRQATQSLPGTTMALMEHSVTVASSDEDDDGGDGFLILRNPLKRKNDADGENIINNQVYTDGMNMFEDDLGQQKKENKDEQRKKRANARGRGNGSRNKNTKATDQTSPPKRSFINGHADSLPLNDQQLETLKARSSSLEDELSRVRQEFSECQHSNQQLQKELNEFKEQEQVKQQKRMKVMSDLLITVAKSEREEARIRMRQDLIRLGNVSVVRAGTVISEGWEDGQAFKDIQAHLRSLLEQREALEKHRKLIRKGGKTDKVDGNESDLTVVDEDSLAQEEICKCRLLSIKREEEALLRDRDRLELDRARHLREMRRIRDEDGSRFNSFPILNKRYSLLNLLGKGGFSEVYKAFDLVDNRYVACKLHSLNGQWTEEKKQSYTRHAIREYNIHKSLIHPHIVQLWDIFEIDHNTFCTVLEYCSGKDLDAVLKATPILPEREARCILVQLFSGLVYMNSRPQRIIHYDLKPGNVLFDSLGVAKMTDFGLSKVVEEEVGSQGMELTSQGAGTYWYLPPECFELNKTPLISSKVDVWSAGVLFYQMLYGKRPFGHGQTQERILREDTIMKAHKVEFPSKPSISNEAKEFIRKCLTYNQSDRPDVLTAAHDPYLSFIKAKQ
ncbi:hypothetical protein GOP47_0013792 [Adiantum capillus-veneris]|uniref:Protein kinase domain-containing protein n=1 Tax=Adiantum capillus-veneris TaxID=13818 RepID=A0A9D4UPF0_ADICA|nr:hypothetical protein GOP47_0013792 [Adiantum capillus-veneris]